MVNGCSPLSVKNCKDREKSGALRGGFNALASDVEDHGASDRDSRSRVNRQDGDPSTGFHRDRGHEERHDHVARATGAAAGPLHEPSQGAELLQRRRRSTRGAGRWYASLFRPAGDGGPARRVEHALHQAADLSPDGRSDGAGPAAAQADLRDAASDRSADVAVRPRGDDRPDRGGPARGASSVIRS